MEQENQKIGFFSRVKIAVAKLENYNVFLEEKTSIAVKYFFLIVLILSVIMALAETYHIMKMVKKAYQYIQNELPDFSYQDDQLEFSEKVYGYDSEFDLYLIADTSGNVPEEKLQEYEEQIKSAGVILLKDKAIYKNAVRTIPYFYDELLEDAGITELNKSTLIEKIDEVGMMGIAAAIYLMILIGLFVVQIITVFIDWLVITIFALISSRICRIPIGFKQAFNISIYALTLSIILTMLYHVAFYVAGFYTDYFRVVYLLIAYVYIVASLLMMKSDAIKQTIEISKIVEKQKEVHRDQEKKQEEEEKENKKTDEEKKESEEKEENEEAGEPDGSEI